MCLAFQEALLLSGGSEQASDEGCLPATGMIRSRGFSYLASGNSMGA